MGQHFKSKLFSPILIYIGYLLDQLKNVSIKSAKYHALLSEAGPILNLIGEQTS
jgi:hypothetical protein